MTLVFSFPIHIKPRVRMQTVWLLVLEYTLYEPAECVSWMTGLAVTGSVDGASSRHVPVHRLSPIASSGNTSFRLRLLGVTAGNTHGGATGDDDPRACPAPAALSTPRIT